MRQYPTSHAITGAVIKNQREIQAWVLTVIAVTDGLRKVTNLNLGLSKSDHEWSWPRDVVTLPLVVQGRKTCWLYQSMCLQVLYCTCPGYSKTHARRAQLSTMELCISQCPARSLLAGPPTTPRYVSIQITLRRVESYDLTSGWFRDINLDLKRFISGCIKNWVTWFSGCRLIINLRRRSLACRILNASSASPLPGFSVFRIWAEVRLSNCCVCITISPAEKFVSVRLSSSGLTALNNDLFWPTHLLRKGILHSDRFYAYERRFFHGPRIPFEVSQSRLMVIFRT